MDLILRNNYRMADGSAENVESLMECTDAQRLSLNEMTFGEFTSVNVPTLITGSYATVNGALTVQAGSDGTPLYIANAQGSTFQDISAAPSFITLYMCLIPSAANAVTYALKACASVYFDPARRGFYEAGTQNRVFGECRKVPGAWPVAYKRLYSRPEILENYLQTYSDGLEINARKLSIINKTGLVQSSPAWSGSKSINCGAATETLFKIRVDYPLILQLKPSVKTWADTPGAAKIISGCSFVAALLHSDGSTEVGNMPLASIEGVPNSDAAATDVTCCIPLHVGTYNIKLRTVIGSYTANPSGNCVQTFSYGIYVGTAFAYVRNVFGDRTGSWGAIL